MGIDWIIFCYRYKTVATILYLIVGICPSLPLVFASVSMSYVTFPYSVLPFSPLPHEKLGHPPSIKVTSPLTVCQLLHDKFLQFDWLTAVVFQLNLKYLRVKITNLLRVVV